MDLTESEREEVRRLLDKGEPLPNKYRFKLFADKREVELDWHGKTKEVENAVLPFQTIEEVWEPRDEKQDEGEQKQLIDTSGSRTEGWSNKLIWGENSLILSSLKNGPLRDEIERQGGIKLIYIDPPFDVGADFSMDIEVGDETLEKEPSIIEELAYRDTWGEGTDSWIAMIYERLKLMHDLLADDGSIYVHCDYRVNAYLRLILNEVFGERNFVNEIIWHYGGPSPVETAFPRKHDTIFLYAKDKGSYTFKSQYGELPQYLFDRAREDDDGRLWVDQNLGNLTDEKIEEMRKEGRIFETSEGNLRRKQYLDEMEGSQIDDVWDIPIINSQASEDVGYPTQKPVDLIRRIIKTSSNEDDIVADFFAGSGTTAAMAEKTGRKWICSDLGKFAIHTTRKRMVDVQRQLKDEGESYRAFEILNLGRYEREYYIGESQEGNKVEREDAYESLILSAYNAQNVDGFSMFAGKKGDHMVAIGPVNLPITRGWVENCVEEALENSVTNVDILGFEFEMGLFPQAQEEAKDQGVSLNLKRIPPEVFPDVKGEVKFYDVAWIDANVELKKDQIRVELTNFSVNYNQNTDLDPGNDMRKRGSKVIVRNGQVVKIEKDKDGVVQEEVLTEKWTDWIDYWAVDFDYESKKEIVRKGTNGDYEEEWTGNYIFENEWQSFRTSDDRELELETPWHEMDDQDQGRKIAVKVVDIFGNDTMKIIKINL
jgi:DNA modification methylase